MWFLIHQSHKLTVSIHKEMDLASPCLCRIQLSYCLTLWECAEIGLMVRMLCMLFGLLWVSRYLCAPWFSRASKCLVLCDHLCEPQLTKSCLWLFSCWMWGIVKERPSTLSTKSETPMSWWWLSWQCWCNVSSVYILFKAKPAGSGCGVWQTALCKCMTHITQESKANSDRCPSTVHNLIYQFDQGLGLATPIKSTIWAKVRVDVSLFTESLGIIGGGAVMRSMLGILHMSCL